MKATSLTFQNCIQEAKNLGDALFPSDCMNILIKNYGKRLDVMKPVTIYNMVYDLMSVLTEPDSIEIKEVVVNFLNS